MKQVTRSNRFLASGASLFAAAATALCLPVLADEGIFGPIHVAANRHQYTGHGCPIEVVFTGTVNFAMPHGPIAFQHHWERSDGAKGAVQVHKVSPNQRSLVVHEKWRLGAPGKSYDVSSTLHVGSGNTRLSEQSPSVAIRCT